MTQAIFYKYAATALLFLNIAVIGFFVSRIPPHQRNRSAPARNAQEILDLNAAQMKIFHGLVRDHKDALRSIDAQQAELLKSYFSSLFDANTIVNKDSILQSIEVLERDKIKATYSHFRDIKSTLSTDQEVNWEEFMNHVLDRILSHPSSRPKTIEKVN